MAFRKRTNDYWERRAEEQQHKIRRNTMSQISIPLEVDDDLVNVSYISESSNV